jgi:DNA polymerase-4
VRPDATIMHVDLDAFFAAVEQLDNPSLRGSCVIVGGLGTRGVVSTASYEAREFGVHSALPMARARKACPHATFLSPRMHRYSEKSDEVMAILRSVTPLVEPLSIDEAFLDVGGARRLLGEPATIGRLIRTRIRDEAGLTASVGAASTKFLAKLASDLAKPDGLLVVAPGSEVEFLAPLPVSRLWGVGPAIRRKLDRMGLRTIGDVAALDEQVLVSALGDALGRHLHALARNDDARGVEIEREAKSIGAEETFGTDLRTGDACDRELVRLSDRVGGRIRHAELCARTITLKIRFANFETKTRARTLPEATDVTRVVLDTARELLDGFDLARGVRLLGVSLSHFEPAGSMQTAFDLTGDDATRSRRATERTAVVERTVDQIRDRFGGRSVHAARLAETAPQDQEPQ